LDWIGLDWMEPGAWPWESREGEKSRTEEEEVRCEIESGGRNRDFEWAFVHVCQVRLATAGPAQHECAV
jgi:hypothetical protein